MNIKYMITKNTMQYLLLNLIKKRLLFFKNKKKEGIRTLKKDDKISRIRTSIRQFHGLRRQVWKDKKKREIVREKEMETKILKYFAYNLLLPIKIRKFFWSEFASRNYKGSSLIKNRCLLCGKAHSVYKKWGLSRICLREEIRHGNLYGIVKL